VTAFRLLALCCRSQATDVVSTRLREAGASIAWDDLVAAAEHHRLEPLVLEHVLDARLSIPSGAHARLQARAVQHGHAYAVRTRVLHEVLRAFDAERVDALILKGAALAQLVYPTPRLRPMLDVDLLVRGADARRAHRALIGLGFGTRGAAVMPDYHHLTPLAKTVQGATITIEVHHELLRATPFLRPVRFDDVIGRAQPFEWAGLRLHTLGPEDMLWHVYAHAFAIDVLRPASRLLSVADLVSLVEAWADRLDWDRIARDYGRSLRALPLVDNLTPWSDRVRRAVGPVRARPRVIQPIALSTTWRSALRRDVLWPQEFWFRMRYGIDGPQRWIWYRFAGHPARVALASWRTAATRLAKRRGSPREHALVTG
jgi:hypothetical protein